MAETFKMAANSPIYLYHRLFYSKSMKLFTTFVSMFINSFIYGAKRTIDYGYQIQDGREPSRDKVLYVCMIGHFIVK